MIKPELFCARFDEEWKVVGEHARKDKGYELRVAKWGESARSVR